MEDAAILKSSQFPQFIESFGADNGRCCKPMLPISSTGSIKR
jgi:hypothetical protein